MRGLMMEYQLTIPATVADDCDLHMLEVTVDAQVASAPFVRCDATPDFKLFPVLWNADPGLIVSETFRVTGMTSPAPIAVYSGKYSILQISQSAASTTLWRSLRIVLTNCPTVPRRS